MKTVTSELTDSRNATHHWYPFLKYQEECAASGKEATVNDWMRASGKLKDRVDFEKAKLAAEEEAKKAETAKTAKTES